MGIRQWVSKHTWNEFCSHNFGDGTTIIIPEERWKDRRWFKDALRDDDTIPFREQWKYKTGAKYARDFSTRNFFNVILRYTLIPMLVMFLLSAWIEFGLGTVGMEPILVGSVLLAWLLYSPVKGFIALGERETENNRKRRLEHSNGQKLDADLEARITKLEAELDYKISGARVDIKNVQVDVHLLSAQAQSIRDQIIQEETNRDLDRDTNTRNFARILNRIEQLEKANNKAKLIDLGEFEQSL